MSLISPERHLNASTPESLSNLEGTLDLHSQYIMIKRALLGTRLIHPLLFTSGNPIGIVGSNGEEYEFPLYRVLQQVVKHNEIFLKDKAEQGFTELKIIPETIPLTGTGGLQERLSKLLIRHNDQTPYSHLHPGGTPPQLLGTTYPRNTDELIPLSLNTQMPLYIWDGIAQAEKDNTLIHYPHSFVDRTNHGGYIKTQLIDQLDNTPFPGFEVLLAQPYTFLLLKGEGQTIGGRKQLENNNSPINYLKTILTQHEVGMTIAHFLTDFATHLFLTNQVSYDYYDKNVVWLIGNFVSGKVPYGYLNRNSRGLRVDRSEPGSRDGDFGCSSAVRVYAFR